VIDLDDSNQQILSDVSVQLVQSAAGVVPVLKLKLVLVE
jgi:hypothetical protein